MRMALASILGFRDWLHQARQFELMIRAIEGNWSSNAAFTALSGVTSSGPPILLETRIKGNSGSSSTGHNSGGRSFQNRGMGNQSGFRENSGNNSQGQNTTGGRRPYIPRCQIYRGEHYADKCPQLVAARSTISSANLAQAFHSSYNVSDSTRDWYLDSEASAHVTNQTSAIDSFESNTGNSFAIVGNGPALNISHIDTSKLSGDVNLLDVLVVPHIMKNLLSISKLTADYPVDVVFSDKFFVI